jgi:hypothetical protein
VQGNAPRRFPPPWSVEELGACFVGSVKERAMADHHSMIGPRLGPTEGRYDHTNSRAVGIIAGAKVVTTKTIPWSAL